MPPWNMHIGAVFASNLKQGAIFASIAWPLRSLGPVSPSVTP